MKRISTHAFALRAARHLDDHVKLLEVLSHPMLRDILETMDAHEAAIFFILGPVQFFKSLVGQMRLARNHTVRPRKVGWYAPTDDFLKKFAPFKLNPLLDAVPEVTSLQFDTGIRGAPDKSKTSIMRRTYTGGASHVLLSATTENDRTSITLEDVYIDEPHLYAPGWIEQIFNRSKDYEETATRTLMSTGMTRGQGALGAEAAAIWDTTDQRLWHSRCPACRRYFEPRYLHRQIPDDRDSPIIGGLRYERRFGDNGLPDQAAIAATLRYQCPRCGCDKFPDTAGSRRALNGTYEQPVGLYVAQNTNPARSAFGWNWSAIAGRQWLPIVIRWELAQIARSRGDLEPLAKVVREEFGGIWNPIDHLKENRLRPPGGYKLAALATWGRDSGAWTLAAAHGSLREWWPGAGFDPSGKPFLIASVDVQQDWFRLVVRAWNAMSQSRLVYTDTLTTAGRIAEICDLLGVSRDRTVLDRRHKPQQVRHWCAQFGWRSLMGEGSSTLGGEKDYMHPDGVRRVISPPEEMDPFLGTTHQGQTTIVENKFAKWSCLDRLLMLRELTANDGTPLFTAADDAPDWYFKELDAYHRIPKFEKGAESREYVSQGADHTADCEIMGVAVASALNLTGAESIAPDQGQLVAA